MVDVLFIVDKSGSMAYAMNKEDRNGYWDYGEWYETAADEGKQRIDSVQNAVRTITNSLSANEKLSVEYSLVTFSGDDETYDEKYNDADVVNVGTSDNWTNSALKIQSAVNSITPNGGTNYQAGILTGSQQLEKGRDNALKVVIFLSDGEPTFYYDKNGYTDGAGNEYEQEGLDNAKNLCRTLKVNYFYTVGVGYDADTIKTNLTDLANSAVLVDQENRKMFTADSTDNLLSAFDSIQSSIASFAAENVVITDPLSDYADLVFDDDDNPQFTIKVERIASEDVEAKIWKTETPVGNGGSLPFKTLDNTDVTVTAGYDSAKKTITLDFPDNYGLEPGYTYSISTVITPSETAKELGMSNAAAQQTPDDNTGTHSEYGDDGQKDKGFWSNDNDNAKVTFTANGKDGSQAFPRPVIQVPEKTTVNLTLEKTFAGLTDEDVYFLLFGQYTLPETPSETDLDSYYNANFSFDVNFCDTSMKTEGGDDDHWMVKDEPGYSEISLEGFTKPGTDEKVTTGDHFKVYAAKCLDNPRSAAQLDQASNPEKGATLKKNDQGDWVYTQTIEIPVTPDDSATEGENGYRYFYTVYELHGEVPGYAKLDPDSAEYTVQLNKQSDGTYEHKWTGLGKFVQANTDYSNIDRANALVNMTNEDEQNGISQNELARLHITSDTTISFINYYTDSLSIQKEVTENDATPSQGLLSELGDKEYTIKIAPADAGKLVTSSSTEAKNGLGPNWAKKLNGKSVTVERTNAEGGTHTDQVTFNDQGEIILKLYRGEKVTLKDIPAINYHITEITPDGEDSTFYDTDNYYLADTLFTENYSNCKVDNGPEDIQYGSGDACTKPGKNNMGPDHWNQYSANDSYGYDDATAAPKTQDGVVSVDVDISEPGKTSVDVVLTNDYEHFKTVTITKHVGGEMGAKDTAFNFTTEVSRQKDSVTYSADVTKQTVSDGKMTLTGTGSSTEVVDVTVGNAVLTDDGYQLSHGDVLTIDKLKKGDTITIVEDEANQNGYDSTYTINETGEKTSISDAGAITVTLDDTTLSGDKDNDHMIPVDVYNDRPVVAPTGLESNHTTPYTLMVTAAGIAGLALIGGIVAARRRRRRME